MAPDIKLSGALVVAATAIGWIGWIGHPLAFGIAVLFPLVWARSPNRMTAGLVSAGYFLAASRGLPVGVANFYETDMGSGLFLWLAAASGFVGVHAALWTSAPDWRRAFRCLIAMVLMAVPPFGIVGWAHPITAAGALFPGWGWAGLAATLLLLLGITTRAAIPCAFLAAIAWTASLFSYAPPREPAGWVGIDTAVGGSSVALQFVSPATQLRLMESAQTKPAGTVFVFPESAAGLWTPTVERLWQSGIEDKTALAGASILRADGYDNAIVVVGDGKSFVLYRQRMPVPVSMWRPWTKWTGQPAGASASFFGQPVVEIGGTRLAVLICYEQLLIWPILQSMANAPEIIVATGNGWWARDTSITPIQKATMQAWARLFGLPLVTSFNI